MNDQIAALLDAAGRIILGKPTQLRLALTCLLARGHLLVEDLPGVGKTTLAHTLATLTGLDYQRIQFTSDLLPADILGVSVYQRETGGFQFHPGPVFAHLVLADEINRATPKTQSALLEAMEERQVTIEGETRPLPQPFFVIATQNPTYQIGTFPLPESQLDRFLMRIRLGYPDPAAERALLDGADRRRLLQDCTPVVTPAQLQALQDAVDAIGAAPALLDYIQALLAASRADAALQSGLSPRAGLALLHAARAYAFVSGRRYATPDDVQAVLPAVAGHRLASADPQAVLDGEAAVARLIQAVPIP